jgi:hypothetical protein
MNRKSAESNSIDIIADLFGAAWAIVSVGALTFASGVLVAIVMREQMR